MKFKTPKTLVQNDMPSDDSEHEWTRDNETIPLEKESESDSEGPVDVFGLGASSSSSSSDNDNEEYLSQQEDYDSQVSEEELLENFKKFNKYKYVKSDSDDSDNDAEISNESKLNLESWGKKRDNYYVSDEDFSDEEQAKEEELEALRLQKAQMAALQEQDFLQDGFEQLMAQTSRADEKVNDDDEAAEKITSNILNLSKKEQLKFLKSTAPKVLELQKEYLQVYELVSGQENHEMILPPDVRALAHLYLSHIAFYLAMVAKGNDGLDTATALSLRKSHPVHKKMEVLKDLLDQALILVYDDSDESEQELEQDDGEYEEFHGIDAELENLVPDSDQDEPTLFQHDSNPSESSSDLEEEVNLPPQEEYKSISEKKSKKKVTQDKFGEAQGISELDLNEKMKGKRSLQFHVKQVEQSLVNRDLVKKALKGDSDLPYKKSTKDTLGKNNQQELDLEEPEMLDDEEVAAEGQTAQDIYGEISDHSSDQEQEYGSQQEEEESDNEYYNMIKSEKKRKRQDREEYHAQIHEPLVEQGQEESLDPNTKRKATYKILANRGLTPYRKKENRNPRVKKRIKYDKALKKLSSVRRVAVDKTKMPKYQGEKTGIKSHLARSTKFQ